MLMTDKPTVHPQDHKAILMVDAARDNMCCQFGTSHGWAKDHLPSWQTFNPRATTDIICNPLSKNDL